MGTKLKKVQLQQLNQQKKQLGKLGEQLAKKLLQNNGYTFIAQNFHTRFGEIDLIFEDKQTLVFVEVKARNTDSLGRPEDAISPQKMVHLQKAAQLFLLKFPQYQESLCRFDAIAIEFKNRQLRHYQNIFD